ncbi:(2Fe-2S)-binding protein [Faecalispora sporosphaeroides]|uniref:(2Fe-2S)-binding protein n=1 Tax=Faecalispora sporosphaeroides TaxID=1549 RepID=UPI00037285A0|nr:(2Fe-2S)-binding protein [Faecalispora sporosphaeroides]
MTEFEGKTVLSLHVNGNFHEVLVRPSDILLDVLREQLGLTGAKAGCKNGDCGACTVMVDGWPAKSCLMLAVEAQGKKITTVEGLGGKAAVQNAFVEANAFQCGYCTSGFLMVCHALLTQHPVMPDEIVVEEWLQSNLCRCTSYQEIREAVHLMYDAVQDADV